MDIHQLASNCKKILIKKQERNNLHYSYKFNEVQSALLLHENTLTMIITI